MLDEIFAKRILTLWDTARPDRAETKIAVRRGRYTRRNALYSGYKGCEMTIYADKRGCSGARRGGSTHCACKAKMKSSQWREHSHRPLNRATITHELLRRVVGVLCRKGNLADARRVEVLGQPLDNLGVHAKLAREFVEFRLGLARFPLVKQVRERAGREHVPDLGQRRLLCDLLDPLTFGEDSKHRVVLYPRIGLLDSRASSAKTPRSHLTGHERRSRSRDLDLSESGEFSCKVGIL